MHTLRFGTQSKQSSKFNSNEYTVYEFEISEIYVYFVLNHLKIYHICFVIV